MGVYCCKVAVTAERGSNLCTSAWRIGLLLAMGRRQFLRCSLGPYYNGLHPQVKK